MIKQRACIACKRKECKEKLLRIVANENNEACVDGSQKINSRAIYICNNVECIEKLQKMKSKVKLLKIKVSEESFNELLNNWGKN